MLPSRCYSKRLLNPFTGTIQVLEAERARATSTDGNNWKIQILSEIFQQPWSSLAIPANYDRYFVYGVWTSSGEINKVPIHPTLYAEHVEQHVNGIVRLLEKIQKDRPFSPGDLYECWLLDKKTLEPVVLVRSAHPDEKEYQTFPKHLRWAPCGLNETGFVTDAFKDQYPAASLPQYAKDIITEMVTERVGLQPRAIWLNRETGQLLNSSHSEIKQHDISMEQFPDLLITESWTSEDERTLIQDFIRWLSPRLLTLDNLTEQRRDQLEIFSEKQPFEVEKYFRLYPSVINMQRLNKIRVEARLRRAEIY